MTTSKQAGSRGGHENVQLPSQSWNMDLSQRLWHHIVYITSELLVTTEPGFILHTETGCLVTLTSRADVLSPEDQAGIRPCAGAGREPEQQQHTCGQPKQLGVLGTPAPRKAARTLKGISNFPRSRVTNTDNSPKAALNFSRRYYGKDSEDHSPYRWTEQYHQAFQLQTLRPEIRVT